MSFLIGLVVGFLAATFCLFFRAAFPRLEVFYFSYLLIVFGAVTMYIFLFFKGALL